MPSPAASISPSAFQPAWRSRRAWATLLIVVVVGLFVDLGSKEWAFRTVAGQPVVLDRERILDDPTYQLPPHEGITVLPWGLLDFDLVLNHGAVFGLGQRKRLVFVAFTLVAASVALFVFARWTSSRALLTHVAIGLILAGGVGNLYDRLVFGAVRDFLHMLPGWDLPFGWSWPNGSAGVFPWVFNIADTMLLAGMAILIIKSGGPMPGDEQAAADAPAAPTAPRVSE